MNSRLEKIRSFEINSIRNYFNPGLTVLEIGGGNGYQAKILASYGCSVTSIDIVDQKIFSSSYYPVQRYNGASIPFPNHCFDVVFSSNVLEHVNHLPQMMSEIRRVLKPEGTAIHILPSPAWRFWTSVAHYFFMFKHLFRIKNSSYSLNSLPSIEEKLRSKGRLFLLTRIVMAGPHGEYPNALAELFYFSRYSWKNVFSHNYFEIIKSSKTKLFYTGYEIFPKLSLNFRIKLSFVLGSACNIFILKPKNKLVQ